MDAKKIIAARVAQEMKDGDVVNLGIGLPTLVPDYLPVEVHITLQSENGFLGLGPLHGDPLSNLVNADGKPCDVMPGAAFFDSAMSFCIMPVQTSSTSAHPSVPVSPAQFSVP